MAKGDKPIQRIKLKRKDGKDGKGINRDGSAYTAKHVEYASIWKNEKGRSVSLAAPFVIATKDPKTGKLTEYPESFINIFDADGGGGGRRDESADDGDDEF